MKDSLLRIIDPGAAGQETSGRACDECQACCTSHGVAAIGKQAGTPCEHLCASGCGIYAGRPEVCAGYQCGWLAGHVRDPEHRPDKLGIIFDIDHNPALHWPTFLAFEAWPDASRDQKAAYIIRKLAEAYAVIIIGYGNGDRRLLGPPEVLRRGRRLMTQNQDII